MKFWRGILVAVLIALPIIVLVVAGMATLWWSGWYIWLWWLLPVCWLGAWILTRHWRRQLLSQMGPESEPSLHWTSRDEAAWEIVRQHRERALLVSTDKLLNPHFYLQSAMDLGLELARQYNPKANDPIGSSTVLEILAVAQLAIEDTYDSIDELIPGSHLLTIDQWRLLAKAPRWIQRAGNLGWAISIAANPLNAARFATSKLAFGSAAKEFRESVQSWGFGMFLERVGFYLIEMNSGRLRSGAKRYRELAKPDDTRHSDRNVADEPGDEDSSVVIAVVGQAKSGKSSLVNALLGSQQATIDILPATSDTRRYQLRRENPSVQLTLLDTPGYADDGATDAQEKALQSALSSADLVLLVLKATSPAREADAQVIRHLTDAIGVTPERKAPPILGVLTHIDQLSPVREWEPPYDWSSPNSRKEHSIREAIEYQVETLSDFVRGVVPVCTDSRNGRVHGIDQWLLPAVLDLLGQARGCSLLRILQQENSSGQVKRIFGQLANAGAALLRTTWRG